MPWYELEGAKQIEEGGHKAYEVGGEKLLVCKVEGKVYATSNYCPHVGAILSPGDLSNGEIICPFHQWAFDVRTGDCSFPPNGPQLETMPVREVGDLVEVELAK